MLPEPLSTAAAPGRGRELMRVVIFCAIAFGLAGLASLVLARTGGLAASRPLVPGLPITVATLVLPTVYMFSPAAAHVGVRLITREGWSDVGLRPRFDRGRRLVWLLAVLVPPALVLLGGLIYFASYPDRFDPSFAPFREQLAAAGGQPLPVGPGFVLAAQVVAAVLIAPWINALFAGGEEFGWRGYLFPKLSGLAGPRWAVLISGVIWGAWHWPLMAMGYEYGFDYPGAPWTGPLLFCLYATALGAFLAWLTVRSGTFWPAALAHGAVNATAAFPLLFLLAAHNPLVGPLPIGALSMVPLLVVATVILLRWPAAPPPPAPGLA